MALLAWSELKYGVNIKDVDEQHQKLIAILNELHEATNVGHGRDVIQKIISELEAYTKYHFGLEEKLMTTNHYPDFNEHKKKHDFFINHVAELHKGLESGQKDLTIDALTFLRDWIDEHITGTDKEYTAYLNGKGVH